MVNQKLGFITVAICFGYHYIDWTTTYFRPVAGTSLISPLIGFLGRPIDCIVQNDKLCRSKTNYM